jgi:signal transduction histidine kinase
VTTTATLDSMMGLMDAALVSTRRLRIESQRLRGASRRIRARAAHAVLTSHELLVCLGCAPRLCGGSDAHANGGPAVFCARCRHAFEGSEPAVYVALTRSLFHAACYSTAAGAHRAEEGSTSIVEAVLAALPGETAILDAVGTIVQINQAWAAASGTDYPFSVGANFLKVCRGSLDMPADVARHLHTAIESILAGHRDELTFECPASRQGQDRRLEVRVRRLARLGGGAVVTRFDVTAERQAQAVIQRHVGQIAHGDRVGALGHLASSIAHELNQPLTAILTNAQAAIRLLGDASPDLAELRGCLADIVSDDRRAAAVIERMRELLRKSGVDKRPLAINDLFTTTIALVANDARLHAVAIEFTPARELPVAYGDSVQIQQVLLNLLSNAIAATAASRAADRRITVRTAALEAARVEVVVHDSGDGIPEADLPRLFEPFFTTKPDGLGMGLAISRMIVEAHGGRLLAGNDPAGGAIFRVHLPAGSPDAS